MGVNEDQNSMAAIDINNHAYWTMDDTDLIFLNSLWNQNCSLANYKPGTYPYMPEPEPLSQPVVPQQYKQERQEARKQWKRWKRKQPELACGPLQALVPKVGCEMCAYRPKGNPKWFTRNLKRHKDSVHGDRDQTYYCNFPGCCQTSGFNRADNLRSHKLRENHFLQCESRAPRKQIFVSAQRRQR